MPKPKKPAKAGAKRKRGRPTEHIAISPEQAEAVLNSWLKKKPGARDKKRHGIKGGSGPG